MTQQISELNLKRMKNLFLVFLKQFEVNEYKYLMQFLQTIITKYDNGPSKLFSFLTNQEDYIDDDENENEEPCDMNGENEFKYYSGFNNSKNKFGFSQLSFKKEPIFRIRKIQKPIYLNSNRSYASRNKTIEPKTDISELQSISSFSNTDSNSSSSNLSNLKEKSGFSFNYQNNFCSDDQSPNDQNYNYNQDIDDTEIDQENFETDSVVVNSTCKEITSSNGEDSTANKILEMEMLANRSDIIDSFILKDTDSIEEFPENNDENEQTFVEENEEKLGDDHFWERFDPKTQQPGEYMQARKNQLKKLKNEASINTSYNQSFNSDYMETTLSEPKTRIRKFSDKIRQELEQAFLTKNFISGSEKTELANRLNLTERQVQKWFVHRREKLRRLEKKAATLNSTLDSQHPPPHHSQIRSAAGVSFHSIRPKLITQPKLLNENPYQKVYYNYRQMKCENLERKIFLNGECENNNENEEENFYDESDHSNENEFYEQDNENNWTENNDNDSVNQNYVADNPDYTINETNCCQDNSEYLNDFENYQDNDATNGDYEENSDNFDENLEQRQFPLKREHSEEENINVSAKRQCVPKGPRRLFPPEVITHLEKVFDTEKYLKENQVEEISQVTNLSEKQIRSWFKQRRYRYNQENKQNGIDSDLIFKKRDSLSQPVVVELEKAFLANNYIFGENKKALSRKLNLKPIQLERWFYYRRKKEFTTTSPTNFDVNQTF